VLAELIPVLLIVAVPLSVYAGVFSTFFDTSEVARPTSTITEPQITEEFSVLTSDRLLDSRAARGGGDLIVEDGVLVPSGVFSDDEVAQSRTVNGEISVYTVREGDSLSQIAEMYGVTTNTILWANEIPNAKAIQPGDTLVILPIVGVRHIVKSGDTIGTIAKKYNGDAEEILAYNQLTSADSLKVGQTIIVPGGLVTTPAPAKSSPKRVAISGSGGSSSGSSGLAHPLPGAIKTQGIHGYNAVDLAASAGTPIRAAAAGEVIVSKSGGWNGGYGNYVVIRHPNGIQTLYAHNSSNAVGVGAYVTQGQTIAYVGSTGRSTGNHLHFEVRGARNPF